MWQHRSGHTRHTTANRKWKKIPWTWFLNAAVEPVTKRIWCFPDRRTRRDQWRIRPRKSNVPAVWYEHGGRGGLHLEWRGQVAFFSMKLWAGRQGYLRWNPWYSTNMRSAWMQWQYLLNTFSWRSKWDGKRDSPCSRREGNKLSRKNCSRYQVSITRWYLSNTKSIWTHSKLEARLQLALQSRIWGICADARRAWQQHGAMYHWCCCHLSYQ